jgi:hypothetical protein
LNLDLCVGICQGADGDERTARKIVAEYFFADLSEAIAIPNVRNEYGHLNHVRKLASGFFESGVQRFEYLPGLTIEVADQRLAGIVRGCCLSGQPNRPASVITAVE